MSENESRTKLGVDGVILPLLREESSFHFIKYASMFLLIYSICFQFCEFK